MNCAPTAKMRDTCILVDNVSPVYFCPPVGADSGVGPGADLRVRPYN